MTRLSAALTAALLSAALPAAAQMIVPSPAPSAPFEMPRADDPPPSGPTDPFRFPEIQPAPGEELSPLDELMNNMLRRAQPHLEGLARDMTGLMDDYAPVFEEIGRLMDDIGNYELPPERLPNGDILIRRKAGVPPPPPLEELPNFLPNGSRPTPTLPEGHPPLAPSDQIDL